MIDVTELVGTVFSGLSALVIEDVGDDGGTICVLARARGGAVACPGCGAETARVHEYCERTAADVPADGRRVLVKVKVRRMRCAALDCAVQTFREQVPGVLDRYQRRTTRLTGQVSAVARELAGRAGTRLLSALGIRASRHTALRVLLQIPLPALAVPRVLGIDDFALRRGLVYATVLIDAETGGASTSLPAAPPTSPGSGCGTIPGVEVVCRDGSGPTARRSAGRCPARSRSATAGTCGTASARPPGRKSPRTRACWAQAGPVQPASAPRPPWSAGSRSTTWSPRGSGCGNAHAA